MRVIAAISWKKKRRMATFLASLLLLLLFTLVTHWYKANSWLYGFCSTVSIAPPRSNTSHTSSTMTREKSYCHRSLDPLLWKTLRENRLITWQAAHYRKKCSSLCRGTVQQVTAYHKWTAIPSRPLETTQHEQNSFPLPFSATQRETVFVAVKLQQDSKAAARSKPRCYVKVAGRM